ncbi:SET and MYND domain-containing protein DDB_G0273589-like [Bradysia coprophila]|uniref:SET and MYND domain-containing protein DDB_G0273589-like n=1 Tax=Bradysia coprophila TaxID=38358 RepID=UPI00187D8F22|nr:SET and MYND domain-containing protein DDB_G0273589-like [Bradysia coprophila]
MLWQKQTNGIYVNICQEDLEERIFERTQFTFGIPSAPKKSNDRSVAFRKLGNIQFANKQWLHAIKSYNLSLCFAETGTEHISLAYGNRSACFLQLNMFDECIADIELAIKADFPARLLPKLEKRKAHCLEQIQNDVGRSDEFKCQLSFEENPNYPGMANVLKLEVSEKYGRQITATSDIGTGKFLIAEKAFLTKSDGKCNRCDTCWKSNVNLVPCSRCSDALFCSQCKENSQCHNIQCGMRVVDNESINDQQMQLVRSLLMGIFEFPNVEMLRQFVEQAVQSDPNEIPESLRDTKAKYRAFLKLSFDRKTMLKESFPTQICFVYKTFLNHRAIRPKFSTKQHRRFLMHLIGHHLCVVQCNTGALMYNAESPFSISQAMTENLSPIVSYINHSCVPNLCIIACDDRNVCISLRPIKTGDQLFVTYFRNDSLKHCTADRQKFLRDICEFDCDCERCVVTSTVPQELIDELKMDVRYQYVRKYGRTNGCCGRDARVLYLCSCSKTFGRDAKKIRDNCVPLLDKFGQIKCAPELDLIAKSLEDVLIDQFEH